MSHRLRHSEDEIRLYTYTQPLNDCYIYVHHLDAVHLKSRLPLDVGRHHAGYGAGLGALDRLPRELLVRILLTVDMPTLTALRAVNKHAMKTVDALYEYSTVMEHCPDVLRAILALDARAYGLGRLFNTLCETSCRWCSEFGGLIHLYTCERTCECCSCYITNTPVRIQEAARITHLSHAQVRDMYPSIRSVPGYYGYKKPHEEEMQVVRDRLLLFDSLSLHGVVSGRDKLAELDSIRTLLPDKDVENTRFMGVISAPYFEESLDEGRRHVANWGYYCAACRCQGRSVLQKFTRAGLVEHIHDEGQIIWKRGDDVLSVPDAVLVGQTPDDLRAQGYGARHDDPHVLVDVGEV